MLVADSTHLLYGAFGPAFVVEPGELDRRLDQPGRRGGAREPGSAAADLDELGDSARSCDTRAGQNSGTAVFGAFAVASTG